MAKVVTQKNNESFGYLLLLRFVIFPLLPFLLQAHGFGFFWDSYEYLDKEEEAAQVMASAMKMKMNINWNHKEKQVGGND